MQSHAEPCRELPSQKAWQVALKATSLSSIVVEELT